MGYDDGVVRDLLARADLSARTILILGPASAGLAARLRLRAPLARIIGLCDAAEPASGFDAVVSGHPAAAETRAALDRACNGERPDLLLVAGLPDRPGDPLAALTALRDRMRPGATAAASLPNAAHWAGLRARLAGDARPDPGRAPAFTRAGAMALFTEAGFGIESLGPGAATGTPEGREPVLAALAAAAAALGLDPARARAETAPDRWILALRAGAPRTPRRIHAVGIRGKALSLSEIRLRQPLAALAAHRPVEARLSVGHFTLPRPGGAPGLVVSYRLHPGHDSDAWPRLDRLAAEGWLILHDVDDHPAHLGAQRANDYRSIRAAHAVTVTTLTLAGIVRPMNPHVHIVPNQVFDLPAAPAAILAAPGGPLRALFAAINRGADWDAQCTALETALCAPDSPARLTAIHADALAARMGSAVRALPFLDYPDYRREMLAADVAICPLTASEFNACKSDLKIVECLAHGTVPLVSAEAAAQTEVPRDHLVVAGTAADWPRLLRALAADRDRLAAMKAAGLDWVVRNRMWQGHVARLDALHDRLLAALPQLEADRRARLAAFSASGAGA